MSSTALQTKDQPEISRYMDIRSYLSDYYQWRKGERASFSYTVWSKELGFKNRTYLQLILSGRRAITERSIPQFVKGLDLSSSDAEYFEMLTRFCQARTVEMRERYAHELMGRMRSSKSRSEVKDFYHAVSSTLGPRVLVLLTLNDVERTTTNLVRILNTKESELRPLLESLSQLKLIYSVTTEGGQMEWRASTSIFSVGDQVGDQALQSYHKKSLQEATEAIDWPASTRRFQSVVVPIDEKEFIELHAEVRDFAERILSRFGKDDGLNRKLYQVNLNLIPVSDCILRGEGLRRAPISGAFSNQTVTKEQI